MKKILVFVFSLLMFLLVLTPFSNKASAACATPPDWKLVSHTEAATSITYRVKLTSNCSGSATTVNLTSDKLITGWSYQYTGCDANTACTKTIPAGSSITLSVTVSRPINAASGSHTITLRATIPGGSSSTQDFTYRVVALPSCNAGKTGCDTCSADAGVCGPGHQTCQHNTLSGGGSCQPASYSAVCPVNCTAPLGCSPTHRCVAQTCTYTYSNWTICSASGTQTRSYTSSPAGCTGTPGPTTQSCTPPVVACTYAYTNWSECSASGTQTRSYTSSPAGCTGTPGPTTQSCPPPAPVILNCPDTSIFSAVSPGGKVPTGGLCMLNNIIKIGINLLLIAAVVFAILFAIWGGVDWVTSEGDKKKAESARGKITLAIIGLVVVFVSFALIRFIFTFFHVVYQ